jgi:O-antigen ligase
VALVALGLLGTASDAYWKQMGTIVSDTDYNHTEESGRLEIWHRGVGYMLGNPLFGVGPNNFRVAEGTLSPFAERQQFGVGVRWNAAHNSYVQVGAELGIPGLVLFVATMVSAFIALHRTGRLQGARADAQLAETQLMSALTASLVGFAVGAFFLSLAYSEMLYTLLALIVGLRKGIDRAESEAPEVPSRERLLAAPSLARSRVPMGAARASLALRRSR